MNACICSWRALESGARRMDDGCTVANTNGASGESINCPRWRVTLKVRQRSDCAAVEPKAYQNSGLHRAQLGVNPRTARVNLRVARLLVNALLSLHGSLPLEMFHYAGQVHFRMLDPRCFQRLIEQPSRGSNKGMTCPIFLIPGLLAD